MSTSSPLTVGLVHVTLRVPSSVVGSTDTLSGTGATVVEKAICLISVYIPVGSEPVLFTRRCGTEYTRDTVKNIDTNAHK